MAVEVITGHYSGGAEMVEKYDDGASIGIDEGHLKVRVASTRAGSTGKTVAAFAPGKWAFARVVEKTD